MPKMKHIQKAGKTKQAENEQSRAQNLGVIQNSTVSNKVDELKNEEVTQRAVEAKQEDQKEDKKQEQEQEESAAAQELQRHEEQASVENNSQENEAGKSQREAERNSTATRDEDMTREDDQAQIQKSEQTESEWQNRTRIEEEDETARHAASMQEDARQAENISQEGRELQRTAESRMQESIGERRLAEERQNQEQSEQRSRAELLNNLRNSEDVLNNLDDEALERVLDKSKNIDQMRGQLVEELGNNMLAEKAKELGEDHEFIRGDQVSMDGKQWTDGVILKQREDDTYDVVVIAEAKAGKASARAFAEARTSYNSLSKQALEELRQEAIEDLKLQKELDTSQEILSNYSSEVGDRMRELHGAEAGQVAKDFERGMPNINQDSVPVQIDNQEINVRVSRSRTSCVTITPKDVNQDKLIDKLKDEEPGLTVESYYVEITAKQSKDIAEHMQAELRRHEENLENLKNRPVRQNDVGLLEDSRNRQNESSKQQQNRDNLLKMEIDRQQLLKFNIEPDELAKSIERNRLRALEEDED